MSHIELPASAALITDPSDLDEATLQFMPQQLLQEAASLLDWPSEASGIAPQLQKPSAVAEAERLVGLKVAGKLPPAVEMPQVPKWNGDAKAGNEYNKLTPPAPARTRMSSCPESVAAAVRESMPEIWGEANSLANEDEESALSTQRAPLLTPITQTVASRPSPKKGFGRWVRVIGIAAVIQAGLFAGIKIGQSGSTVSPASAAQTPVTVKVETAKTVATPKPESQTEVIPTVTKSVNAEVVEASILEQASEAAKTDIEQAHRLLQSLPRDSADRKDPAFIALEGQWADAKLAEAKGMDHRGKQLALLHRLINTRSLTPAKRQKALDMAHNIESNAQQSAGATPDASSSETVAKASGDEDKTKQINAAPKAAAPVAPQAAPSVVVAAPQSHELVGNSAAARQKAALYGVVASGNASMGQMLHLKAACVQLQDMPCAMMAVRMMRRTKTAQK